MTLLGPPPIHLSIFFHSQIQTMSTAVRRSTRLVKVTSAVATTSGKTGNSSARNSSTTTSVTVTTVQPRTDGQGKMAPISTHAEDAFVPTLSKKRARSVSDASELTDLRFPQKGIGILGEY